MSEKLEPVFSEEETEETETIETTPIEQKPPTKKETTSIPPPKKVEPAQPTQRTPTPKTEDLDKPPNRKKRVIFNLTTIQHEKLKQEAYEKNCTMGSIVRETIDTHFENLETVKSNPDNTEAIEKIEACMKEATGFFGSFDLEEFLALAEENELTGDTWTPELLETYLIPKLRQASEGLFSNDLGENTNATFEALQLDEKNREYLAGKLGLKLTTEQEVKEKGFELM